MIQAAARAPYARIGDDELYVGDCREVVPAAVEPESIDSIVTDPPYDLVSGDRRSPRRASPNPAVRCGGGFMGMGWDATGVAFDVRTWEVAYAALKPGGHLVAFGGTRTWHRIACAVEDAGFEIRDTLAWLYGSGFPKSLDVSKAIDRAAGAQRAITGYDSTQGRYDGSRRAAGRKLDRATYAQDAFSRSMTRDTPITEPATDGARLWEGWGTALKPCHEPIILARKPLSGTVAANVLEHGTGALNIDGCRIATDEALRSGAGGLLSHVRDGKPYPNGRAGEASAERRYHQNGLTNFAATPGPRGGDARGRWPGNVVLGCACEEEHEPGCAVRLLDEQSGTLTSNGGNGAGRVRARESIGYGGSSAEFETRIYGDSGGASRFFYTAKASRAERTAGGRVDNPHPTVKPLALIRWLARLVTPPGGRVLDLFAGSGTMWAACMAEGFAFTGVELLQDHAEIIYGRAREHAGPLFVEARHG